MGGKQGEENGEGGLKLFGGWLRRTLSHRWKKGWKRNKRLSLEGKQDVENQSKDGEKSKKDLAEEEEDTRSENDSAYESLPGSARGVAGAGGGDTSREMSQSPSWEKQKSSWESLSGGAPTSIIKPGSGEGTGVGGRQPKKKVSFPERDVKSEGEVERKRDGGEKKVKVRPEKREACSNGWVRREGREGWVRRSELEVESKREDAMRSGLRRRDGGGRLGKGVEQGYRFQGASQVPKYLVPKDVPKYLVPREVTRYRGGSQSVASQVEAIRGETRAWLKATFPRLDDPVELLFEPQVSQFLTTLTQDQVCDLLLELRALLLSPALPSARRGDVVASLTISLLIQVAERLEGAPGCAQFPQAFRDLHSQVAGSYYASPVAAWSRIRSLFLHLWCALLETV